MIEEVVFIVIKIINFIVIYYENIKIIIYL